MVEALIGVSVLAAVLLVLLIFAINQGAEHARLSLHWEKEAKRLEDLFPPERQRAVAAEDKVAALAQQRDDRRDELDELVRKWDKEDDYDRGDERCWKPR
jgi:hypothetical protein